MVQYLLDRNVRPRRIGDFRIRCKDLPKGRMPLQYPFVDGHSNQGSRHAFGA
jgi:hypothetical protein